VLSAQAVSRSYKVDHQSDPIGSVWESEEKESVDGQAGKRRLGGWCEMAESQLYGSEPPLRVDLSREAAIVRSRYQATTSEDTAS
jgi:hypothetical protein